MPRHLSRPLVRRSRHTTPAPAPDARGVLTRLAAGRIGVDEALAELGAVPAEDLGFATIDHDRARRKGFPEVVFCQGKPPRQAAEIFSRLAAVSPRVLATRASADHYRATKRLVRDARYDELARAIWVDREPDRPRHPGVAVVAAGTSDLPVAEEAARTLEVMGHSADRVYDVGVAGLHRLVRHAPALRRATVVIVVAGMEGALPSVVGGLVSAPVIAVPTSVGYGASFGGVAALLGMLNSCAPGVAVVNIDNGFGAGYMAAVMNQQIHGAAPSRRRPRSS
jgi:pyridinium-3,5-biscarboxylic acid mononucleotide synthase